MEGGASMSVDALKQFMDSVGKDDELSAKVKEAGTDADKLIELGKEKNFEFTRQDMKDMNDQMGTSTEELSDEDLEKVAGGFVTATAVIVAASVASAGAAVATAAHA